jgi:signal transduction histidine kinase
MYCSAFEQLRESSPEDAAKSHEAGAIMLQKALAEARRLIAGLRPAVLDESGLVAAVASMIEELESREGIEVEFVSDVRFERLDPVWENSLFRIVQESLTNAARYSGTTKIRVQLAQEGDRLILEIQDWGRGFDPSGVAADRFGIKGIRERASLLGGQATIDSAPGEGTRIHVELPVNDATTGQGVRSDDD